ncbi:GerAB/ArcD/ProY family transporter [Neobacillus niacini]|uniref:GerAB/ArcD/ProY family transporter n=1 Tax=Neobacillus niacini TaxID=86668 RepID=UPI0007ABBB79|nr:GerAB/ArcD/ProY family transporter [Neobacillus niacini]MEC1522477.1 GerAB/ArcD/ProY family transporter [Neobacillus niacini]
MNRYFFYLVFVNMVANVVASVPKILISHRTEGAIVSMIISFFLGLVFCYLCTRFFNLFPGKGLPDLTKKYLPRWLSFTMIFVTSFTWYIAGLITLVTFSFLLKRFLTPDMPLTWITATFLAFLSYGILMKSKSVLFTIETVLLFCLPFIFVITLKAYTAPELKLDFIKESLMYINHYPSFPAVAASIYLLLGGFNLVIFNRLFKREQRINWKNMLFIGFIGGGTFVTTFFIPIGMLGFDAVEHVVYPWITTSDTLRLEFFIVERVLYIFLLLYLAISFLSVLIHWHVTLELLKSILWFKKMTLYKHNLTPYLFIVLFWLGGLKSVTNLTEYQLIQFSSYFLNYLLCSFAVMFGLFWMIKRRAKV